MAVNENSSARPSLHPFMSDDAALGPICGKVLAGERLTSEDALSLYASKDILALGWMANHVRERLHGDAVYYNVNRHINYTNICCASCKFCAFGRFPKQPGAYAMTLEEAFRAAGEGYDEAVTEFHVVGGLNSALPFQYYLDLLSGLKQRFPKVHLKCFTMVEIAYFARLYRMSTREVLTQLKAAGLDSMPGGGAEIFTPRVREQLCDHKIDGADWLRIAREAHEMGVKSNATMLYGHIENDEDRVDHLLKLRELQDATGGFQAFIPLRFHPDNTQLAHLPGSTGIDDLKQIAVARLVLDNFAHVKAYWQMLTPKLAQTALRFGADDMDGTVVEEKIYHDAGAETPQGMTRSELVRLIEAAGRTPIERDTLYRPVERRSSGFQIVG